MHFVIHALDKPNALPRRMQAIAAHRTHLDEAPAHHGVTILLSGPLTSDDGGQMCGSFFLVDAPDRAAVEALFAQDPLSSADVWATRTVTAVTIRQNNMAG